MNRNPAIRTSLAAIFCVLAMLRAPGAFALTLYVSPTGNNAWSGKSAEAPAANASAAVPAASAPVDGPLASLAGARDRIRAMRDAGLKADEPITVLIAGGAYPMREPAVFEPRDSGTPLAPVRYMARPGERPVFRGGTPIGPWEEKDGKWSAPAPLGFNSLFVNGGRATRARTPNQGYFHIAGKAVEGKPADGKPDPANNRGFRYREGDLKAYPDPNAIVVGIHSWETSILPISAVNEAERRVTFKGPAHWEFGQWDAEQRYYVENVSDALDAPGEWFRDEAAGRVTYIPRPGETPATAEAFAPIARQFLVFRGDVASEKYVRSIQISGLTFEHADWELRPAGNSDAQAAFSLPGVIEFHAARDCSLTNLEVRHVGYHAVRIFAGSRGVTLEMNHMHDLGAGAIYLGEPSIALGERDRVGGCRVNNNYLHDGGRVFEAGEGVWIGQTSDNAISHNEIGDFGYTGISMGWTWGYAETGCKRNLVEFNHIHHIGTGALSDMGGIYTLGDSTGSVLRGNYIHDVTSFHYGGWGIYPDEGTTNLLIEGNVAANCKTGGFHQHYGKENVVRNNVFAFAPEAQLQRSREEDHSSFTFERNIVIYAEGELLNGKWGGDRFAMNHNIFWRTDGVEPKFGERTLAEWRAAGHDVDSKFADPMLIDPEKGDFGFKPGSPAADMGIAPIHVREAGLVGPEEWRKLPEKAGRRRGVWAGDPS